MEPIRKKNYQYFIGSDVSKSTIDHIVMHGNIVLYHKKISNDAASIRDFIQELKAIKGFSLNRAIFGMERTGIYCNHLLTILHKFKANIIIEGSTLIKNSLGNLRGKSDKVDAGRIASFLYKNRDELKFWSPRRLIIDILHNLTTLRSRLIGMRVILTTPLKEEVAYVKDSIIKQATQLCFNTLSALEKDISAVDAEIKKTINSDDELSRLMKLITSVPGVGEISALQIIITTNEFKNIQAPKKFACYSGVAPFEHTSGSSVKGKTQVSQMANKKMKSLLHTCAISARRFDPEIRAYYLRKTEVEGKNKMSVLNAIRFKIILRVYACVLQNRIFIKGYKRGEIMQPLEQTATEIR